MTLLLFICCSTCSVVEYSIMNRLVATNLLFDACMLTGSCNRLLFLSFKKLLRRQVFREFYHSQAGLNFMHACDNIPTGSEIQSHDSVII